MLGVAACDEIMTQSRAKLTPKPVFICALLLAAFGCASGTVGPSEALDLGPHDYVLVSNVGTGWKGIGGKETTERIFAPPGASAEDWTVTLHITELPIAVTLGSNVRWNAESLLEEKKASLKAQGCTDPWTVIRSDENSILYERTEVACPGYLHNHEIGRVIVGKYFMWWVSYRMRNTTLTTVERNDQINRLEQARIVE